MEYGRALSWSRAVTGLFLVKPDDFIQCWEDQRMGDALSVFLSLRRHARSGHPQDAISAYDLALHLPVGPKAWSSRSQHYFVDCLLRLIHRALFRLYGAGARTDVGILQRTVQVARRTVEHWPLLNDYRIVFLTTRSRALQLWSVHTTNADSMCLCIAISHRQMLVTHISRVNFAACRGLACQFWNICASAASPQAFIAVMNAIIAFLRDVLGCCPSGHPSAHGLRNDFAQMLQSMCALRDDTLFHDEYLAVSMESILGQSSMDSASIDSCMRLSFAFLERFHETRKPDQLAKAAMLCNEALQRCPRDHPSRSITCHNAGSVCLARYKHDGDVSLLRQAIQLRREALFSSTADDAERAEDCKALDDLLDLSFQREGDVADLHGRVEMCREVLRLRPDGHPDRADACNALSGALMELYNRLGLLSALEESIALYEEALSLTPPGHRARARSCSRLAAALCSRHEHQGETALLRRALILQQEALQLNFAPEAEPLARAEAQCDLATTMAALDNASGSHASEQECVALYREALEVLPETSALRGITCSGLLDRLLARFHRTTELPLLNDAVRYGHEAVSLTSPRHSSYSAMCIQLGQALQTRFDLLTQAADLDEAISLQRMALSLMPPTHPHRIATCGTLALSLSSEFFRSGDFSRLDEAILLQQEAYSMCPESGPQRASVCSNYASLLSFQFQTKRDITVLDKAIELSREALRLHVPGQARRSVTLNNLGSCLVTRFECAGDLACLDEGIQLLREAVELRPRGHAQRGDSCCNLAQNLLIYILHTKDTSHLEEVISLCKEVCDGGDLQRLRYTISHMCLARAYLVSGTPFFDPPAAVTALREATNNVYGTAVIVDLISELVSLKLSVIPVSHMRDLLATFCNVVACLPRLSNATMSFQTRLQTLEASQHIGEASLHCAILAGDLQTGVELMEQSRAVFWSQALHMRDPQLGSLPNKLRTEIENLLCALSLPPKVPVVEDGQLTARDLYHRHHEQLQKLITEARTLPGLTHFMLGTPYEELALAFADTAVVMFSADSGGCRAVVIVGARSQPVHLQLNDLSLDELANLPVSFEDRGMHTDDIISGGDNERAMGVSRRRHGTQSQMEQLLSQLWRRVMQPVLVALSYQSRLEGRDRPRVILCPTGPFTFAPLHAAGIYEGDLTVQECVSDYAVCSYVPTLSALQRARKGSHSRLRRELSILAIAEGAALGMPPLPTVDLEVKGVRDAAEKASLRVMATGTAAKSTIQHAVANFTGADIVHLACHGVQDAKDALQSGFCLGDGRLTVAELMKLDLPSPFLAFLSACETAKGDRTLPDQTVHLAAAMLFCGFQNAIGTMWSMGDEDGPRVAERVYAELFAREDISAEDVPYALDAAVQELRNAGVPPARWATFIHLGA